MLNFRWETDFRETVIGKMPSKWEVSILGELACIDETFRKASESGTVRFITMQDIPVDGHVPLFETVDLNLIKSGKEVPPNSVLVAKITPSFEHGKTCIVPEIPASRWFATSEVFSIKPKSGNDLLFLFYLLKHPTLKETLENSMTGTTGRERVQTSALRNLIVPHPSQSEQSRIAFVLTLFDDLMENKRKQNEVLDRIALATFRSWFVDFDPFGNEKFVKSEIGEIPTGWEVKPIGDIADFRNGFSYLRNEKYTERVEGSHVFVTLNNAIEGGGFKTEYFWIKSDRLRDRYFLDEGDLIMTNIHFGVGGSGFGRLLATPALVTLPPGYGERKAVYSMDITKISPSKSELKPYLYLYLRLTREDSVGYSTGTGILHLDIKNFKRNKMVVCPPDRILAQFASIVEPLFQKIASNQKQILVLRKMRNILLPLLVFGKLRIEEV